MYFLHIRSRKHRVGSAVVLILVGVAIDVLFSAHPVVSIGLLLGGVVLFAVVLVVLGRVGPRRS